MRFQVAVFCFAVLLVGCGTSSTNPPPGLKKRVFLSNLLGQAILNTNTVPAFPVPGNGAVDVVDAGSDRFDSTTPFSDLPPAVHMNAIGAANLATAGGITAVLSASQNGMTIIDNSKQQVTQRPSLQERGQDLVMSSDGKTAYVAVRNAGLLDVIKTADSSLVPLPIPSVARLILSPNGTKLLAFSDDPQSLPGLDRNAFFVVDTASNSVTPIVVPGADQPFTAVFDQAETRAFILNCGAECHGNAASVMLVDFSGAPQVIASVPVAAATSGLLSGSTLYVAGTPPGSASGTVQAINVDSMSPSAAVSITDGLHLKMKLANSNRLYIGGIACTPGFDSVTGNFRGCLSIFNTQLGTTVFPEFSPSRINFDVTGIQPIHGRSVVYVCEGGSLDIFDATTDSLAANQLDAVGEALDVVQVDP
jgi:hypothetical protein